MIDHKRGKSFRIALKFDDSEWESIYPHDYLEGQIRLSDGTRRAFEISSDPLTKAIFVKADTFDWPLGDAYFDIRVVIADIYLPIPDLENILVTVIEGITQ